jgi:hypothetical protein
VPERPRVLFVVGAGHCGSTLLSLLMNGHPDCIAVSELGGIAQSISGNDAALAHPEWQETARRYEARTGRRFTELDLYHPSWKTIVRSSRAEIAAQMQPRAELMQCLIEVTGKSWVVDASKSWQQLYLMNRSGLFDLHAIHLVRDAHGIVHSYTKKYKRVRYGLVKWAKSNAAALAIAPLFGKRWLRVRYEDLTRDPAAMLARICEHVGFAYVPEMLDYRSHVWLGLGGNRMAKRTDSTIRLDERWRTEMSPRDRLLVDLVGGVLDRYYGYGS